MCGFVAVINNNRENLKYNFNELRKINKHRGPDEIKILHKQNYSLLFRRLEIIDLNKRSSQPFSNEDNKINLVFNGEIYNYLELKNYLERKKIYFRTTSDTEVILRSYQYWGTKFVQKLRGMFSIIIFDEIKKRYICCRDRLGQKPLFYSKFKNGLVLSSEIKDILFLKKKCVENDSSLRKYLLRGWCDDNQETFFKDIYSFPAASIAIIDKSRLKIKKYWKLDVNNNKKFNKEEFDEIFTESLKIHLRADVPVAFTLSGGLDSSSLVYKSQQFNKFNNKSFSLNATNKSEKFEEKFIKKFVKQNSINHSFYNASKNFDKDILEKLIFFQDEPISSISFINQFLLRRKIKSEGFKVLIVGEGGDEVLAGYNRMFAPYLFSIYYNNSKKIPSVVKKNISLNFGKNIKHFNNKFKNYKFRLNENNDIEDKSSLKFLNLESSKIPRKLSFYNSTNPYRKNSFKHFLLNHIFKRDLPHILRQEDRISMSQSIENRSPFVDHKLLEYIFSIDQKYFMYNGESKYMLRSIMKNKLPNSYFKKKKIGRPGDTISLIFNTYFDKFLDKLSYKNSNNYFDVKYLKQNLEIDRKEKIYNNSSFYFRALNYLIWKENFF